MLCLMRVLLLMILNFLTVRCLVQNQENVGKLNHSNATTRLVNVYRFKVAHFLLLALLRFVLVLSMCVTLPMTVAMLLMS